jgi:cytochrome c551/c552
LCFSSLNVFLFRHNASAELSPYRRYFEQARGDPFFNGRVDFPDDVNGILREAFYHLFLAAQAERLEARQQHMEHFNLLLIAHEQMLAQPFYKAMASQQEALAGSIVLHDPLGTYALVDEPWSNFGARMSLDLPPGTPVEMVTVETLLANTARPGTVPHYYRSRLRHPDATLLFNTPPEVQRVSLEHPAGAGTDGNTLMQRHGCLSCHRVDVEADVGTMVGPDLSRVGARLSADQIRQAIVDPGRTLARDASGRSYPPGIMPVSYAKALRADEIDVLTRHLATHR